MSKLETFVVEGNRSAEIYVTENKEGQRTSITNFHISCPNQSYTPPNQSYTPNKIAHLVARLIETGAIEMEKK